MMRISATITGDLHLTMENEIKIGKLAAAGAVGAVGGAIKTDWRGQIVQAGLGRRLGNTVRSEVYPKSGGSLNAAALVWSKAKGSSGRSRPGSRSRQKGGGFWRYRCLRLARAIGTARSRRVSGSGAWSPIAVH